MEHVLSQLTTRQVPFRKEEGEREGEEDGSDNSSSSTSSSARFTKVVVIEGLAKHLGMECRWKQHFHFASGAFFEELVNEVTKRAAIGHSPPATHALRLGPPPDLTSLGTSLGASLGRWHTSSTSPPRRTSSTRSTRR